MGYTDVMKLPVNLEKLENCLSGYLVDMEQMFDDEICGTWVHDGKIYEDVLIPINLTFTPLEMEGGTGYMNIYYKVWCDIRNAEDIINHLSEILDESELTLLRSDMLHMDTKHYVEQITFYNMEIV